MNPLYPSSLSHRPSPFSAVIPSPSLHHHWVLKPEPFKYRSQRGPQQLHSRSSGSNQSVPVMRTALENRIRNMAPLSNAATHHEAVGPALLLFRYNHDDAHQPDPPMCREGFSEIAPGGLTSRTIKTQYCSPFMKKRCRSLGLSREYSHMIRRSRVPLLLLLVSSPSW